jgi:hypothetical protein
MHAVVELCYGIMTMFNDVLHAFLQLQATPCLSDPTS